MNPLVFCVAVLGVPVTVYCWGGFAGWWPRWRVVQMERGRPWGCVPQ
ncbi:MAG: hypothetical protein HC901_01315 [Bdellovibrionaceae bacterium]|nr:hypothetical protein [Pseudobdellovibrionaceae bacterium]